MEMKKRFIPRISLFFVPALVLSAVAVLSFLQYHEWRSEPYFEVSADRVSGVHKGDIINYDLIVSGGPVLEDFILVDDKGSVDAFHASALSGYSDKNYNLNYRIQNEAGDIKNVSFQMNREDGSVLVLTGGLNSQNNVSLSVNQNVVHEAVPADWNGHLQLKAGEISKNSAASICVDIGGYRGGSLTVCHAAGADKLLTNVQFGPSSGTSGHFANLANTIQYTYIQGMQLMTMQITAGMMKQIEMIGRQLSAKDHLEVMQLFQLKQAQAHKDYHPSANMCRIGTFVRSLSKTEQHNEIARATINDKMISRELAAGDITNVHGSISDYRSRLNTFTTKYCLDEDNQNGLERICNAAPGLQSNRDINYTQLLETPLTLNINFEDPDNTEDEQDVFSMLDHLFSSQSVVDFKPYQTQLNGFTVPFQDLRSIAAMRGIARNSMSTIIAEKAGGPASVSNGGSGPFMKSLMSDMGLSDDEVEARLGSNPSYFAQMELLTKTMYQTPEFVSNLYDKPANVERMVTAMKAIKLMQDRDIHKALMRREMLLSMLLEVDTRDNQDKYERDLFTSVSVEPGDPGPF